MRNLKRALSLLLSSTMVLGMLVMGSSAAGYQDVDASNDNQEAIEVLQAVGIMTGDENGNFNPDGSITRNEMAVVMAHLLNLDYDYYRGTNPFTDVPEWAAPYVAACAAEGVVAGIGNGQYGGDNKVTAAEASLMIMKALGYFENAEDFGTDWQVATIRQASYIDLFKNINATAESALTRGQVAQLVLNGLKSDLVYFTGDKGIQIGDITVGYRAEYTIRTSSDQKYNSLVGGTTDIVGSDKYTIQLGEELYNGKLTEKGDTDAFGRPATTWRYDYNVIGTYVNDADLTYTAAVDAEEIYADLGLSKSKTTDVYYVDGKEETNITLTKTNDDDSFGGNGVLTQVWYDEDEDSSTLIITEINTYVAKIGSVNKASSNVDRYITLATTTNVPNGVLNNRYETESFEREDLVTYTAAYNNSTKRFDIQDVEALSDSTTGILTRWVGDANTDSSANFTIDSTLYNYSENFAVDASGNKIATNFTVDESEMVVYTDAYGYALYIAGVESAKNYAVVIGVGDTNPYGSATDGATLLLPDGTQKEVKYKLSSGSLTGSNTVDEMIGDMVTYTVKDDVYTLTIVDKWEDTDPTNTTFTNGKSAMDLYTTKRGGGEGTETKYTTSETVFFVATDGEDGKVYNVYTGYAAMPSLDSSKVEGVAVALSDNRTQVEAVYVSAEQLKGIEGVDTFVSFKEDWKVVTDNTGSYYVLPAVEDGNVTEVKLDYTFFNGQISNTSGIYALDNVITDSDGIITSATVKNVDTYNASPAWGNNVGIVAADGVVVGISNTARSTIDNLKKYAQYWAYTDETEVYYVSEDYKVITDIGVNGINTDLNDVVFYSVDTDTKTLDTVIIFEVEDGTPVTPPTEYKFEWATPSVTMDGTSIKLTSGSGIKLVDEDGAGQEATNVVVTYQISAWNGDAGDWNAPVVVESAKVASVAAGTGLAANGFTASGVFGAGTYKVTVTVTCDQVTQTFSSVRADVA